MHGARSKSGHTLRLKKKHWPFCCGGRAVITCCRDETARTNGVTTPSAQPAPRFVVWAVRSIRKGPRLAREAVPAICAQLTGAHLGAGCAAVGLEASFEARQIGAAEKVAVGVRVVGLGSVVRCSAACERSFACCTLGCRLWCGDGCRCTLSTHVLYLFAAFVLGMQCRCEIA